jgi:hypothetical protein
MARAKLFVSYSHHDRPWLERLKIHLGLLQRRGLVHVWSDTRIEVGARWQDEIETALAQARAAVLLVSADFLASDFIWKEEMPRILAHQKDGMVVLPLIARPCAWRIAPELAELQARPVDGRPLSLGTEADVDRDLAAFVYEIAGRLQQLPGAVASEEVDSGRARGSGLPEAPTPSVATRVSGSIEVGQRWVGVYHPTDRKLRFLVEVREEARFRGTLQYLDDGGVSEVEGHCRTVADALVDQAFQDLSDDTGVADLAVTFRESRISKPGTRRLELDGEYLALLSGERMKGAWRSQGKTRGHFELRLEA